jgi:hypothetical protein
VHHCDHVVLIAILLIFFSFYVLLQVEESCTSENIPRTTYSFIIQKQTNKFPTIFLYKKPHVLQFIIINDFLLIFSNFLKVILTNL